jgi:phosphoglycolate phosphatase
MDASRPDPRTPAPGPGMRLFLFDIDGTLVRLGGAGRRSVESAFGQVFGVEDPHALFATIRFDGNTDRAILREAAWRGGVTVEQFDAARLAFESAYLRHLAVLLGEATPDCVLPGVVDLLRELAARGDETGLLTGNSEAGARAKLEPFGLNAFFPLGAFGSDHEDRVVLADLAVRRFEERSGRRYPPDRVHVIGDSVMDVRAGRAHGFRTIAVATGWTDRAALASEAPALLLNDLRELLPLLGPAPAARDGQP